MPSLAHRHRGQHGVNPDDDRPTKAGQPRANYSLRGGATSGRRLCQTDSPIDEPHWYRLAGDISTGHLLANLSFFIRDASAEMCQLDSVLQSPKFKCGSTTFQYFLHHVPNSWIVN